MGERTGGEVYLNKAVNVDHQSLGPADDKLVHTGNGMRPVRKQNTLKSNAVNLYNSRKY